MRVDRRRADAGRTPRGSRLPHDPRERHRGV